MRVKFHQVVEIIHSRTLRHVQHVATEIGCLSLRVNLSHIIIIIAFPLNKWMDTLGRDLSTDSLD